MTTETDFIVKLIGASQLLEQQSNLEDGLRGLAGMTAELLHTDRCSIMLLSEMEEPSGGEGDVRLRIYAHYGNLPKAAYKEATRVNEGIAGYVAATGKPLLIQDITKSDFFTAARHVDHGNRSLISAPIVLAEKVIGVINVSSPKDGRTFTEEDLDLVNIFSLFVGKSIHTVQLQNVLKSRFLQLAMAQEDGRKGSAAQPISPDPARLAKLVAKTIYRELTAGGFGPSQIISVTSEVINLLNENLEKHKKRLAREHRL
jgi:L-methionine (R)-S-oxide reductase